jgi:hypothetical protein
MPVLIEITLALLLLGGAATFLLRGRRDEMRAEMTGRRVTAYMETIRREAAHPELRAMSDTELRDLLLSSAHNLRVERDRKGWVLLGVAAVALISAILVGTQDGTRGFGIALAVGALAVYGLNEFLGRRIREPLLERGLDLDRLKVE